MKMLFITISAVRRLGTSLRGHCEPCAILSENSGETGTGYLRRIVRTVQNQIFLSGIIIKAGIDRAANSA
jgi:hypothetical protein